MNRAAYEMDASGRMPLDEALKLVARRNHFVTLMDDELQELCRHQYHQSRIPALDAVETFVADGEPLDSELAELRSRTGFSRWYPVEGGHRVLVLYEGGGFNPDRFRLRKGAWDHEHCKRCSVRIPCLTLCWVSRDETYIVLCDDCYGHVSSPSDAAG